MPALIWELTHMFLHSVTLKFIAPELTKTCFRARLPIAWIEK